MPRINLASMRKPNVSRGGLTALFGVVLAFLCTPSQSQPLQPSVAPQADVTVAPRIPCEDGGGKISGLNFSVRSAAIFISPMGCCSVPAVRLTLNVKNNSNGPIGLFLFGQGTSASTDTGLAVNPSQVSGISLCETSRAECLKNGTESTIGAGASANMLLTFTGSVYGEGNKQQAQSAREVDFAGVIMADIGGEKGFYPLSCVNVSLRNNVPK